jgi:tetratricopeptide (TPR) repeat protein
MDLLKQCQQWFEQDEAQKVIDTLEAIPAEERTPELDSELAKAYIAVAHIGEREPFEKALELLAPHEEHFAEDHCWNYRIASAYYFLDEEGPALRYFEKALKARPGDKDTQEYIDDCRRRLSLPRFEKNFRERTQEAWAAFSQIEAELRQIIDTDETHQRGEELVKKCGNALKTALRDTSFELGFNGEKHELILSPEGLRSLLFPLVYFQKQAPESVLEHWNIWVGRQPCEGFELRAGEIEVRAEDVQMWAEETEDHQVSLVLYCEKLTPILKEDTDKVWWALSMLVDQTIGEVSAIAFVAGFDVYAQPKDEPSKLLSELPELLQSMGLSLWRDGSDYLENSYLAYELEPVEDPEADWRLDVYTGSCRLPVLINDYLTARSDMVDEYHKDGIAAGFLLYPLSGFTGEERVKAILDFRDNLRDAILRDAGEEAVTFLGGATGLYCGYLDFIAWDLPAVLTAAQAFFEGSDLPYAHFHAFRRDVGGVPLLDEKEPEPDIHEETGSLLSTEDIEILESFDEGTAAYFGKMLDWLENFIKSGVEEGRFSEKQAHQDLQIALWYAFACLNLDDYIHYYRAAEWMKDSEKNATGCATWYYRYSVALMYCGRLEEALEYAERGALEEPDYPWIWLHLGKLRAHFGDKSGALDAVKQGLKLEPGDYEFLTLKKEIKAGATLEQMEYHWINPDADQTLQRGLDENADDKQCAIACIRVDEAGLAEFYELFHPERYSYKKNFPCCEFQYPVKEHLVELSFRMNEAGLSKMGTDWLRQLKERLDSGEWLTHTPEGEPEGILTGVFVDQTRRIGLVYQQPGDDQYFQIFLNPDGTKADAFWSSRKTSEPEVYSEDEPSDLAEAMMEYLDCECTYFPSMTDDDPIMSAYNYAKMESVKEGFVPVLIKADDEILWECLIMNSDPDSDGEDDYTFDPDKVAEYRKKMLSAPVENSKAVLEEMIGQRKEEAEDDDMDWDEEILGEMEGGYDNRRFSSYWNSDNNMTYPLILAKIPVKNPWEIFAYLPFGGWNECSDTPELMAVAKYWFEQHGAVPAAMSHDELEFLLPAPVPEEKAMDAAVELYGFCPDVIDQGPEDATVGALADVLRQSTVWYFWWD